VLPWIEAHQSLVTHRKTLALAEELHTSLPAAIGHLICLWTWALDNAPDGNLGGVSVKTLAYAAHFTKRPQDFFEGLITAGFVDRPMDGPLALHDWESYAGRYVYQKERNKKNQQAHRHRLRVGDITSTSPSTEPNRTEPNRTEPITPPTPRDAGGVRASRVAKGSRRKRDLAERASLPVEDRYLGSRAAAFKARTQ
jgi:hypothetical protein